RGVDHGVKLAGGDIRLPPRAVETSRVRRRLIAGKAPLHGVDAGDGIVVVLAVGPVNGQELQPPGDVVENRQVFSAYEGALGLRRCRARSRARRAGRAVSKRGQASACRRGLLGKPGSGRTARQAPALLPWRACNLSSRSSHLDLSAELSAARPEAKPYQISVSPSSPASPRELSPWSRPNRRRPPCARWRRASPTPPA